MRSQYPNIRSLGGGRNTKFGTNVSNKMALNTSRVTAFTFSEFLRENQKVDKITPPPTQIRVKVGDIVRISKFKNIFAKGYTPNCSGEVFVIIIVKNTVPWTYVISDFNEDEIIGTFSKKQLQKKPK